MLKQKRLELKKLPDSKKIDCITINVVPFKGGVEDVFKKLSEALVETLRDSIEKEKDEVEGFIDDGTNKLNVNPKSVAEIQELNSTVMEIEAAKGKYGEQKYNGLIEKNRMIK
jgi:hypothetical protein